MESVQSKVAVVTGAASGIGLGMTRALAGAGAHVAMLDVEDAALANAHAEFGEANVDVRRYQCDVSDAEQVEDVASRVRRDFGGVHIVCNNAGVGAGGPIDEATLKDWQWVLGVNLYGVVNGMRTFVPIIKETIAGSATEAGNVGHVVNTASVMGLWTNPGGAVYGASKFAVVAISETTRAELEPFNIGVSALCPYIVDTRILKSGRNRPAKYGAPRARGGAEATRRSQEMAALFSRGISIDGIGEMVLNGILGNKAYIFTHASSKGRIRQRFERILADFDGTELKSDP